MRHDGKSESSAQKICGALERDSTKAFRLVKADPQKQLVFGWASLSVRIDGTPLVDLQGDVIEPDELEAAAYDFVKGHGVGGVMHEGEPSMQLVESLVFTADKIEKMNLGDAVLPGWWWVGFWAPAEIFARVRDGDLTMFSIEGTAVVEDV